MSEHIGTTKQHGADLADPIVEGYRAMGAVIRDTPARVLIEHLLGERGCGWDMLYRVTGIKIRHLRLWRGGEAPDPDGFARVVEFSAFLDRLITAAEFTDPTAPTAFMESPITGTLGYHRTPFDFYLDGHRDLLLDLARSEDDIAREHLLDRATPGWRERRSDFEVYTDTDGQRSLRRHSRA